MTEPNYDQYVSVAQEYFRRADAGRADIWGLEGRSW